MVNKLHVSRHGLTPCPTCKTHIQVAAAPAETRCVFCGTAVAPGASGDATSGLGRFLSQGRSSLLAASMLGLGTIAACDTEEGAAVAEDGFVSDAPVGDVYGLPPDAFEGDLKQPDDSEAETSEPDASQPDAAKQPDVPDAPMYGLPPDVYGPDADQPDASSADAIEDVAVADEGPLPQPLYGLPPIEDAGPTHDVRDDADEDAAEDATQGKDDIVFMPLYGLPPGAE